MSDDFSVIFKAAPRVLIVDNDIETVQVFQDLVTHWGFKPIIARGEGTALLDDAVYKAHANRCQLALLDMRLIDDFDEDDQSGLDLISQIKPAESIIVSGFGDIPTVLDIILERGAVNFVGKGEGPLAMKKALIKEAAKICASKRGLSIGPESIITSIAKNLFMAEVETEHRDQILDALARLFPDAQSLTLERMNPITASPDFVTAPRPRSVVLKVYENDLQPVLIKLARLAKIHKEASRFLKFIKGRLDGNYTPVYGGHVDLWDIGGIKFSYVGHIEQTFGYFAQTQPLEKIKNTLERFFLETWAPQYQRAREVENISLFDLYCSVLEKDWVERIEQSGKSEPEKLMGKELWDKIHAPDPIEWIQTRIIHNHEHDVSRVERSLIAITHGDLHADNLLIDTLGNAWVVDFERSGEGHALQDFIELESDMINRITSHRESFPGFHRLCIAIAAPKTLDAIETNFQFDSPNTEKVLQIISIIRTLARQCTNFNDSYQYLMGLFFNTLFRATIIKDEENAIGRQRALMLASILCHRLDHWNEAWPPEEWKTF